MTEIMQSIRPNWCELIISGKKTIEVRKTRPKIEPPFKVYIYCTKFIDNGCDITTVDLTQKVIGEYICDKITEYYYAEEYEAYICWLFGHKEFEETCLSVREFETYGDGKTLYGWHISDLKIYDKPLDLINFQTLCKFRDDDGRCRYQEVECDFAIFDFNPDYSVNGARCYHYMTRAPQDWCYVWRNEK